jgi:hypothetical protein
VQFSIEQFPRFLQPWLEYFHVDFKPRQSPNARAVAIATLVAVVGSLVADFLLVKLGIWMFPAQKNYAHFQFLDYAKLTIIGVVIAGAGWPVVTRISSQATWLFLRMAIVVTLVLLLPDVFILLMGQPLDAVFVLVWMHLAIAVVTYLSLILIAPVPGRRTH